MKIRLTQPNFVELGLRLSLAIVNSDFIFLQLRHRDFQKFGEIFIFFDNLITTDLTTTFGKNDKEQTKPKIDNLNFLVLTHCH